MTRETKKAILLYLLVLLVLTGCRRTDNESTQVLRINLGSEPPTLDWQLCTDSASITVIENIMEGLTRFNDDMEPVPALAESWQVSEDGLTYTFKLKDGVVWSDGVRLKAQHFVDGWKRLLDPATAGEYAYFLYNVENAEKFNNGEIKDFSQVGVKAIDEKTLEIKLNQPVVFFPSLTAFVSTFPVRLDVIEKWGDLWTEPEHIVTLGPFRLNSWQHEYKIELVKNEKYHGEIPKVNKVVMYMVNEQNTALDLYETGVLDFVSVPAYAIPFFKNRADYHTMPFLSGYYYGFNVTKPPFDKPQVRQAFSMAIDREVLRRILNDSVFPTSSWIPPGLKGHNPNIGLRYNPEKARQLLSEAGYDSPSSIPPITLAYNTNDTHKLIAENIKEQWKKNLGIDVRLDNMEWKVYLQKLKSDPPQIFRLGWNADYPDADNFMAMFMSMSGNNHTRWTSAEYDNLIKRAVAERDTTLRAHLYEEAQRILVERDCVIMPLFFSTLTRLISPRVRGLKLNVMDILYLEKVRIKELEKTF